MRYKKIKHLIDLLIVLTCAVSLVKSHYVEDARDRFISGDLVAADQLKLVDPKYIHLAMIIVNINVGDLVPGIVRVFKDLLYSIFYRSKGTAIHLILITDEQSKDIVHHTIKQSIGQYLSETSIRWILYDDLQLLALQFPRIYVELVDINSIVEPNREAIDTMKKLYSNNIKEAKHVVYNETFITVLSPKYSQDLFYIGPHYLSAFTQLDRLMVFDVDLIVKDDLGSLYKMFDEMEGEEAIGLALDQGGYYKPIADDLLKSGMLKLENETLYQGVNTGVVLYNLENLRTSQTFQEELKPENYAKLIHSFNIFQQFGMVLGDQEWFNLLLWRYPQLFKILPCEYNWQHNDIAYFKYECTAKPKIHHLFGKIHEKEG